MNALLIATALLAQSPNGADEHFQKIQAVGQPAFDAAKYEKDKEAYVKEYEAAIKKGDTDRNKLILDFYKAYPEDPRLPDLMVRRWTSMYNANPETKDLLKEIDGVSKSAKNKPMQGAAAYAKIVASSAEPEYDWPKAIEGFRKDHKESKYYEQILSRALFQVSDDKKKYVVETFLKDFPDHRLSGMLKGQLRQIESVGKPFELTFDDAVTGKKVDMKDFKGKVVMIDWWATWCGPCIQALPHVREVYKKYKDQGFEIIGISLDQPEAQGGLSALKEFVAKNDMPWAHYYQGNGWDSTFSSSWGIMSIPNVFLVDREGILRQVNVEDLEPAVQKLLKG